MTGAADNGDRIRSLQRWLTVIVLALASFQAYALRYAVGSKLDPHDSLPYLDMSRAVVRGDWHNFVNGYWSPLQPLLFGLEMRALNIQPRNELLALAALDILIGAFAWWSFCYVWRQVVRRATASCESDLLRRGWWLLGFTVFAWCAFEMNQLAGTARDVLLAAWIFLATGLLLRMRDDGGSYRRSAAFGVALGLGYLTKAFLFPMGLVFLGLALFAGGSAAKNLSRVAVAAIIFLLIGTLWIVPLSRSKGRITYGDVGPLAYAWLVNQVGEWDLPYWPGLHHPPRLLMDRPMVLEYATPVGGTFPLWYDATYWTEGVRFQFHPGNQARAFVRGLIREITFPRQWEFAGAALFLIFLRRHKGLGSDLVSQWDLVLPAVIALAAYALVYVEERYAAAFLAIFWAGVLIAILRPSSARLSGIFFAMSLSAALVVGGTVVRHSIHALQESPQVNLPWLTAEAMQQQGLRPGDVITYVGDPFSAYWAHCANVRIVAHVEHPEQFWAADPPTQARVNAAFTTTQARFAVADSMPGAAPPPEWQPVGNTGYFIYRLRK